MSSSAGEVSKSQYAWMYASNGIAMLAGLAVYHLAGTQFGPDGFAEYALSRRAANLLAPALMLGMGVALPRQIAVLGPDLQGERDQLYQIAATWVTAACVVVALAAAVVPGPFAGVLLGSAGLRGLVLPLAVFLGGLSWHSTVWAYCRGTFRFRTASILDMCNLGAVPLLAFLVSGSSPASLLVITGAANALIALAFGHRWLLARVKNWRGSTRLLLSYGLPRVPGDFALGALLALPSLAVARTDELTVAGYVAFGNTMLAMAGASVAPFSAILLPQSSRLIAEGRLAELRVQVLRSLLIMVGLAVLGLAVGEALMPFIVRHYLGEEFIGGVSNLRALALCVVPYLVYCLLRSVIDGAYQKAINARNTYVATLFMVVQLAIVVLEGGGVGQIVGVTVVSHFVLGGLTLVTVWRLFTGRQPPTRASASVPGESHVR